MSVQFSGVSPELRQPDDNTSCASSTFCHINWSRVNICDSMSSALQQVNILACLLGCTKNPCVCADHRTAIDNYYQSIIRQVSDVSALHSVKRKHNDRSVPGWSDYVADKYGVAKKTFNEWVYAGKPRSGAVFSEICKTRAAFKLCLRYCRRHVDQLKADGMARDLLQQSSNNEFWKNVSRTNAQKIINMLLRCVMLLVNITSLFCSSLVLVFLCFVIVLLLIAMSCHCPVCLRLSHSIKDYLLTYMWQQQFANLYSFI